MSCMRFCLFNRNFTIFSLSFRVDHLYTFFVQWSPEIIYNKHNNEKNVLKVETDPRISVIDALLNNPASKPWNVSDWHVIKCSQEYMSSLCPVCLKGFSSDVTLMSWYGDVGLFLVFKHYCSKFCGWQSVCSLTVALMFPLFITFFLLRFSSLKHNYLPSRTVSCVTIHFLADHIC